jgi:hypothetical protein
MATFTIECHDCRKPHSFDTILPFREECDKCAADLHVCITCSFHDRYADNECREVTADPVQVKDRRNLCEYYKPLTESGIDSAQDEVAAAKAKLEALFSKK